MADFSMISRDVVKYIIISYFCNRADRRVIRRVNTNVVSTYRGAHDGLYLRYFPDSDRLRISINYTDGKRNGLCKYWHDNGQLKSAHEYVDNELHGICHDISHDGQIEESCTYITGKIHGTYISWHQTGAIRSEVEYRAGYVSSKSTVWDINGDVCSTYTPYGYLIIGRHRTLPYFTITRNRCI